jgi:hypothetical protein
MTDTKREQLAQWAIFSLTLISVLCIGAGLVLAYFGVEAGAVIAVVSGAVGGIVAIVLRDNKSA